MGSNQYWAGRVYDLCVYYMTGTPKGSTESGFMEKPGIEPATPGLQGIALIHYTTGASVRIMIKISIYIYSSEFSYTILPSFIHVIYLYILKTSARREKGEKVASMIVFHYFVKL